MNKQDIQTVLDALTCCEDHPHWCTHCDDYVDRSGDAIAILQAALAEPSEAVYIRRDQLQKARRMAYLCEVGPESREDKVAVFTHPAPSKQPEPSEPYAWEYTNVQSGFKQLQSYPPEHFAEWNDMEMWHVTPLFTHPASKPAPLPELSDEDIISMAYDCNALPECITDKSLMVFARAILAAAREKNHG